MIPRHGDFFDDPDMAEQLAPDEVWLWQASAHGPTDHHGNLRCWRCSSATARAGRATPSASHSGRTAVTGAETAGGQRVAEEVEVFSPVGDPRAVLGP